MALDVRVLWLPAACVVEGTGTLGDGRIQIMAVGQSLINQGRPIEDPAPPS